MKKLITILLVLTLVICMTIPVYAITPTLQIPDMPEISKIQLDVNIEIPDSIFDNWFKKHPIVIDWSKIKFG